MTTERKGRGEREEDYSILEICMMHTVAQTNTQHKGKLNKSSRLTN